MKIALIQCPARGRQNPPLVFSLLSASLGSKDKLFLLGKLCSIIYIYPKRNAESRSLLG